MTSLYLLRSVCDSFIRFPKQIPVLTGIRRFSYVAGLAAFLFVTLSLGASHQKRN